MENIETLTESLEQEELKAQNGIASADVYKKLLAVYLIHSDPINAKFLWKRIPADLKQDAELQHLWKIGQFLWKRDFQNVFSNVSGYQWSDTVLPLMTKLAEKHRNHVLDLIGKAYSDIKLSNLCVMLGLDENQVLELIKVKDWQTKPGTDIVNPTQCVAKEDSVKPGTTSDLLLSNLTDYITFLEN